jgi:hypothetical protein
LWISPCQCFMLNNIQHSITTSLESSLVEQCNELDFQNYARGFMFYLRYLYQTRFPYQMMFVPYNSNRRVSNVAPVLLTIAGHPSSPPVFLWGLCCSIFKFLCSVLMVIICSSVCSFGRCAVSLSSSHGFWLPPFSIFWLPPLSIF